MDEFAINVLKILKTESYHPILDEYVHILMETCASIYIMWLHHSNNRCHFEPLKKLEREEKKVSL